MGSLSQDYQADPISPPHISSPLVLSETLILDISASL